MIHIDGSLGEGGGQVLRTSLALSLLTDCELHITNIRARRKKPGLHAQHLEAVKAAAQVGKAEVEGAALGSLTLHFRPNGIHPGRYQWDIGTAGATTLVFQTVYLPLASFPYPPAFSAAANLRDSALNLTPPAPLPEAGRGEQTPPSLSVSGREEGRGACPERSRRDEGGPETLLKLGRMERRREISPPSPPDFRGEKEAGRMRGVSAASHLTITGGTHVPWSPCYHYLELQWLPFMQRIGLDLSLTLEQAGFYPQGGGKISAVIRPTPKILPLTLTERGALKQIRGISAVANLDRKIAERQRNRVVQRLGARYPLNDIRIVDLPSRFKGTLLLLLAEFEHSQACYFSLGEIGKPAERVADDAINAMDEYLATDGAIDQYLADQLLLPLAFASGASQFRTSKVTQHLLTNAEVIRTFLPVKIEITGEMGQPGLVAIEPGKAQNCR